MVLVDHIRAGTPGHPNHPVQLIFLSLRVLCLYFLRSERSHLYSFSWAGRMEGGMTKGPGRIRKTEEKVAHHSLKGGMDMIVRFL